MTGRRWWQLAQVLAGLTILFFAARQFWKDWDSIRQVKIEWRISPVLLLLSALVTLSMYALLITAWRLLLRDWGQQLAAFTAARIWTIANLGKYIPGKIWAIAGLALMAQKEGIAPWTATASAILLQALAVGTGVIVVGLAGTGVLAQRYPWTEPALWALALVSAIAVGLLVSPGINRYLTRRMLHGADAGSPRPRAVLFGIMVNLIAWAGYGCAFWLLQRGSIPSAQLSVSTAIGSFTASYLAGLLFLLAPGGLLVRESFLVLLLEPSIGLGAAGALAVASRLMLTLTEVGVAVPFLIVSTERRRVPS
jgi:glycosyltransferase 2 family protein